MRANLGQSYLEQILQADRQSRRGPAATTVVSIGCTKEVGKILIADAKILVSDVKGPEVGPDLGAGKFRPLMKQRTVCVRCARNTNSWPDESPMALMVVKVGNVLLDDEAKHHEITSGKVD